MEDMLLSEAKAICGKRDTCRDCPLQPDVCNWDSVSGWEIEQPERTLLHLKENTTISVDLAKKILVGRIIPERSTVSVFLSAETEDGKIRPRLWYHVGFGKDDPPGKNAPWIHSAVPEDIIYKYFELKDTPHV